MRQAKVKCVFVGSCAHHNQVKYKAPAHHRLQSRQETCLSLVVQPLNTDTDDFSFFKPLQTFLI